MIRKPSIHPEYGIKLRGTDFLERWNIIQHATKAELQHYIKNCDAIILENNKYKSRADQRRNYWQHQDNIINEKIENAYYRNLWRVRYFKAFDTNKLYKIDKKKISNWDIKLSSAGGIGLCSAYRFSPYSQYGAGSPYSSMRLYKDDIMIYSHSDELGNVYFLKAGEINAPHLYCFNRENKQLGYFVEVES